MALLFAALFVLYREPENARLIDVVGSLEALYVIAAERMIDQRSALALNVARQELMHLSLSEFKALVRHQAFLLQLERERAVDALASLVPDAGARQELLKQVHAIGAGDPPLAAERDRLTAWRRCWRPRMRRRRFLYRRRASLAGTTARRTAAPH